MALKKESGKWREQGWILSIASVAFCTGIAGAVSAYVTIADVAMLYLLGIVITASLTSRWPSLLATLLSVTAFDFFFVPPYLTLAVSEAKYLFTFIVMFIVAYVISTLTLRMREQAKQAEQREKRTAALYNLSRELAHERELEHLCSSVINHMGGVFSSSVVILLSDGKDNMLKPIAGPHSFELDQRNMGVAQWVFEHGQQAGLGTDTLPGANALYLPLIASSKTVGVVGVFPGEPSDTFDDEQIYALESFANQSAMAIERALLAEETQKVRLKAETETLRNTMLSSVSHDLRTPLAAITGAASTLLQQDIDLDQSSQKELMQTIIEEAEHLNQIIRNVLDMTRLEAKTITVKKEWQSLEEIIGAVLNRLSDRLSNRQVTVSLPENLPLIPFDPLLIEQVLINLIDNALKYTPQSSPLALSAVVTGDEVIVELCDSGPGITPGNEERIFEKFARDCSGGGGIGLGLAICRTIINAHGGRIWAENRENVGAVFKFSLPFGGKPPKMEEENNWDENR